MRDTVNTESPEIRFTSVTSASILILFLFFSGKGGNHKRHIKFKRLQKDNLNSDRYFQTCCCCFSNSFFVYQQKGERNQVMLMRTFLLFTSDSSFRAQFTDPFPLLLKKERKKEIRAHAAQYRTGVLQHSSFTADIKSGCSAGGHRASCCRLSALGRHSKQPTRKILRGQ